MLETAPAERPEYMPLFVAPQPVKRVEAPEKPGKSEDAEPDVAESDDDDDDDFDGDGDGDGDDDQSDRSGQPPSSPWASRAGPGAWRAERLRERLGRGRQIGQLG